jgi:hypothetical protein
MTGIVGLGTRARLEKVNLLIYENLCVLKNRRYIEKNIFVDVIA